LTNLGTLNAQFSSFVELREAGQYEDANPLPRPPRIAEEQKAQEKERRGSKMPPHLHPRSRLTSSLFATTLFASFFVVALPHILPCPAPRVLYADDGTPIPRKRRRKPALCPSPGDDKLKKDGEVDCDGDCGLGGEGEGDDMGIEGGKRSKRECPVPKPGGIVGEILGFKASSGEKGGKPP